jgi:hypothetical protein
MAPRGVFLFFFFFFKKKQWYFSLHVKKQKNVFNDISLSCFQPDFDLLVLPVTQTLMAKSDIILFLWTCTTYLATEMLHCPHVPAENKCQDSQPEQDWVKCSTMVEGQDWLARESTNGLFPPSKVLGPSPMAFK